MPLVRKPTVPSSLQPPPPSSGDAALTEGSDEDRWAAARAAADRPGSAPALGAALMRESNPRVREAMFTSLGRIGTPSSVEALVSLVRSDDAALRTGALDTLRGMKTMVRPHVARLIHDADADVRLLACELVRNLPGEDANALLCALLDSEQDPNVCGSAIEVLSEVGQLQALASLARCQARFHDVPFLTFSIQTIVDRIRTQSAARRE